MPRYWWDDLTKELARRFNHHIEYNLHVNYKIKVKTIFVKSLLRYLILNEMPDNMGNEVLPGFLEADGSHPNYWGYQALVNEIVVPLTNHKGI